MSNLIELFKNNVRTPTGESKNLKDLSGKIIGLYFSAHWCPPCRMFTPKLVEFYKKHSSTKNFEIIFLSSDNNEASFNEYYSTMPWLSLAFEERQLKVFLILI
jgi:nucleoredoxin